MFLEIDNSFLYLLLYRIFLVVEAKRDLQDLFFENKKSICCGYKIFDFIRPQIILLF